MLASLAGAAVVAGSVIAGPLVGSAGASTRRRKAVTISYMVGAGSPFSEVVQKLIAPVFTKQTGINVNIVELPYEQTFPKAILEARNKSGAYDVIQINRPSLAAFVEPNYLLPVGVEVWPAAVSYDLDAALPKSDVVMMLRVQRERMGQAYFPSEREYSRRYGLDRHRMGLLPDDAIVMHPGPMNRGLEISSLAADGPRSVVLAQVQAGVAVRMAVLFRLLSGADEEVAV